ncbi:MAG: hypothetical protein FDZ69_00050 [Deltaproteobacteria bacterium]|nr:MAG: hypothetical protein FDZ69_00050 [Deltaproteobacteria bacterium]
MIRLFPVALLFLAGSAFAATSPECLSCHERDTPAAVARWRASAHAGTVGCVDCHGSDHEAMTAGAARVDTAVCGRCHERAFQQHVASRHGMGLHSGWGCTRTLPRRDPRECRFCHEEGSTLPKSTVHCARFLAQSSEMGEIGCNRCHQVESSCASCHTSHGTDLAIVRRPEICATCHMGPDHPQWEMWQTSRHGVLYSAGGETAGPSCQGCHMPAGSHNVSAGITMTSGMDLLPADERSRQREKMLDICASCHPRESSRRELARGDAVREQSVALVDRAAETIRRLNDRNLLRPSPEERPPHPLSGQQLVLDSQMLYENLSRAERLFFKMKKYDLAKAVKGAYHQNPAYAHWYGNAELKLTLSEIESEAALLDRVAGMNEHGAGPPNPDSRLAGLEQRLQELKRRYERGGMTLDEYTAEKARVLEAVRSSAP